MSALGRLGNIFKVSDLRNRVLFTIFVVAFYQLGANLPVPGVDIQKLNQLKVTSGGILAYLSLFTGNAIQKMAVFGLGIMPYITSSIIVQMLTTVIPKLTQWRDEGAVGQRKLTQVTRYLTVALALMQASGLAFAFHNGGILNTSTPEDFIPDFTFLRVSYIVLTLTAGTAFVMWLGELITQRGIGQGMSILIFANVVATLPGVASQVLAQGGPFKLTVIIVATLIMLVAIVWMEQGQRRIPVTFAKRLQGRRMYGGQTTYIPLKVNQSGVVPVIFASSLLYMPVILSNVLPSHGFFWGRLHDIINNDIVNGGTSLTYIFSYGLLIVVFAFFFVRIVWDPHQQADIIRKQGGYIPGYRPGPPTEGYLSRVLNRITLPGSLYLAVFATLPAILLALWHIGSVPYYGTTVLISVGVTLETLRQIDSQLLMRNYEGFLS
jgi:preprotein translocase subunit SecY